VITLCDMHGFATRVSEYVEPGPLINADCVDYKRIAVPTPNRMSVLTENVACDCFGIDE